MKHIAFASLLIIAVLSLLVIGCGNDSGKSDNDATEITTKAESAEPNENLETVKTDDNLHETAEEMAENFDSVKSAYIEKAGAVISDWDTKINNLVDKKEALPEIAQKPLESSLDHIGDLKGEVDSRYKELNDASEDTFEAKKNEFEDKIDGLNSAYEDILGKF